MEIEVSKYHEAEQGLDLETLELGLSHEHAVLRVNGVVFVLASAFVPRPPVAAFPSTLHKV